MSQQQQSHLPSKSPTKSISSSNVDDKDNAIATKRPSTTTSNKKHPSNTQQLLKKASKELSKSLSKELPFLMYGSGDVYPYRYTSTTSTSSSTDSAKHDNDPNTVSLLAELTCDFIHDLVHAAIDSHDIYTNGKCFGRNDGGGGGGIIPNPNFISPSSSTSTALCTNTDNIRKRNRDWEEELPIPIITSLQKSEQQQQQLLPPPPPPPPLWQGSTGLNISSNEIRSKYMSSTQTINEKSFLLPIYHDETMYNRCKEILSFHQDLTDVLFDPVYRQVGNEDIMDGLMNGNGIGSDANGSTGNGAIRNNGARGMNDVDRKRQKQESVNSNSMNDKDRLDIVNWPGFDSLV